MNDEDTNQYVDNNSYKKTDINELEHKVEETKIQEENNNVQEEIIEMWHFVPYEKVTGFHRLPLYK